MTATRQLDIAVAAATTPDAVGLVSDEGTLTFAELSARAASVAEQLLRDDHPPGMARGVIAEPTVDCLVTLYALFRLGAPAVLLHPRLPRIRQQAYLETLGVLPAPAPAGHATWRALQRIPEDRPLAIVATSGSTGDPRGVALSRRAFVASARASASNLGWLHNDRWLLAIPPAHVGGLSIVTRCLIARRPVVLKGAQPAIESIGRHQVTLLSVVPAQLARLVDGPAPPECLRAVLVGGAPTAPALLASARDRGWPVLATYGLTETCSQVATQRLGCSSDDSRSVGYPLAGVEIRTSDRIEIRGPTLFSGWVAMGAPPACCGLPIHPPPLDADGWYRTDDTGFFDSAGRLHVTGRADDVIITGGQNVAPAQIEATLEALPEVAAACVFGVPDDTFGQCVAAVLELGPTAPPWRIVLAKLAEHLAPHERPRQACVVSKLSRLPNGKLDRRRIRTDALDRLERVS